MHGSRNFCLGGSRFSQQKKTFDNVFIIFYLTLVLNLFSVILSFFFKENYNSYRFQLGQRFQLGSNIFQGGGGVSNFFLGEVGVNADFYRNLLIFGGGGGGLRTPISQPLWIRAC